jgi:UDP-glucuronate 4-epimerase
VKFLVTGSAGFIGFHVARRLIADGHFVAGFDALTPYYDVRMKEKRHALLSRSNLFRAHIGDLCDQPALARVMTAEEPDIVIHLAAQAGVRYSLEHPETYVSTNVVGTFNLLELCRARPPKHFLFASTSSAYGANTEYPFRESERTAHPLTIYAATKIAGEVMAHSYAHLWNMPTTAFRFFTVYGPWSRPDMAPLKFANAIVKGEPIEIYNHGNMARDFTFIDDLVEAIVRLIAVVPERGRPVGAEDTLSPAAPFRTVNIGNGEPAPLLRFVDALEAELGRKAIRRMVDMQPGDVPRTWADSTLLERLTGFRPNTPVEVGIAAFVKWHRAEYGS